MTECTACGDPVAVLEGVCRDGLGRLCACCHDQLEGGGE